MYSIDPIKRPKDVFEEIIRNTNKINQEMTVEEKEKILCRIRTLKRTSRNKSPEIINVTLLDEFLKPYHITKENVVKETNLIVIDYELGNGSDENPLFILITSKR
jgi:hypothetical protein